MTERDDSARRAGESAGLSVSGVETDTQTDAAEERFDALADQLDRWEQGHDGANETDHWADRLARALLASDWLAAREAAAEARGAERALREAAEEWDGTESVRLETVGKWLRARAAAAGGAR